MIIVPTADTIESAPQVRNSTRLVRSDWGRRASIVLKATRQSEGLSQETVAERCGWTRNMVANIESGRACLRFQDFMAMAVALGEDPYELLRRIIQW